MSEGVPEVEQRAFAGLALVRRYHHGLVLAGTGNGISQGVGIARAQLLHVDLEPREEGRIHDQTVLDHFGKAGRELAFRQRIQRRGIGEHQARLVEGADHVLAAGMVDRRLAANGGIHLREQRGRHLDEWHAALVSCSGKTGEITDHAAPQRDDGGFAFAAMRQQMIENGIESLPVLVILAVVNDDRHDLDRGVAQRRGQRFQVKWGDRRIGDDRNFALLQARQQKVGAREQPPVDVNRVGALGRARR